MKKSPGNFAKKTFHCRPYIFAHFRYWLGVHMSYKKVKHAHDSVGPSHSGLRGPGGFLKHGVTTHIVEHHAVTQIVTRPEVSTLPPPHLNEIVQ